MILRRCFLLALLLIASIQLVVAQNPLFRSSDGDNSNESAERTGSGESSVEQRAPGPGLFDRPGARFIRDWSNTLQRSIATLSRRVRQEGDVGAGLAAFGFAVLFGMVHIAGPGHGKIFALSYFSSRESKPAAGVMYSAVVNTVDSLSAFVLVFLGYVVLVAVAPAFRVQAPRVLEIVSYSLIVVFGVAHLVSHLKPNHHEHNHHVHHNNAEGAGAAATGRPERSHSDSRNPWVLALTVGLIPCPVSTVLLVYGLVNSVLPFMIVMVIGVSVGGFIAMTVISVTIITGRKRLMELLSHGKSAKVATVLEFVASGFIIVAGLLLLLAALG